MLLLITVLFWWFFASVVVAACYSILRSVEKSFEEEFNRPLTSIERRRLGNQ